MRNIIFDVAIRNGLVVDGSGRPSFRANLGIKDGRIVELGPVDLDESSHTIDASGLVVAPGFIDIHSHSDITLIANPRAESKVRQGVTTEVVGNCGGSAAPFLGLAKEQEAERIGIEIDWKSLAEYLERLDKGVAVNVATLVGHGTVRQCVMDMQERAPTRNELEEMKELVDGAMKDGAFGLSSGLVYPPGRYAETSELIELCKVVAKHGGFYASHIRGERETMMEALSEAIKIGECAEVPVQISHHPAKIGAWGRSMETLTMMAEAQSKGVDVTCDMHPYIGGSTALAALLPPWAQADGPERIVERLRSPEERGRIRLDMIEEKVPGPGPCGLVKRGMWEKILISAYPEDWPIGRNLAELASEMGVDTFDAYFDLLEASKATGSIIGFYYNEEDIRNVLRHQSSMIGSDGYALAPYGVLGGGRNHPRSYGTFPMVIRKYVKGVLRPELIYDEAANVISLEEAVKKMTSLPARKLKLNNRGLIKVGCWADVVIFDPEKISDTATYLNPYIYPNGIEHVLVNGVEVVSGSEHKGVLPGKALRLGSEYT